MSRLIQSDFNRDWERARRFHRVWFAIVATLALTIIVGTAYSLYRVVSEPEIVGEYAGKIVTGFQNEVN